MFFRASRSAGLDGRHVKAASDGVPVSVTSTPLINTLPVFSATILYLIFSPTVLYVVGVASFVIPSFGSFSVFVKVQVVTRPDSIVMFVTEFPLCVPVGVLSSFSQDAPVRVHADSSFSATE